jgi:hypothetical protein
LIQLKGTGVVNKSVDGKAFNPINLSPYDLHKLSKA